MNNPELPEPKPSEKFKTAMKQILSVPKAEIDRREAEYKRQRQVGRVKHPTDKDE